MIEEGLLVIIDGMTLIELQCRWSIAYGWYFWAESLWKPGLSRDAALDAGLENYALAIGLIL